MNRKSFWEEARKNRLKTLLFFVVLVSIYVALVWFIYETLDIFYAIMISFFTALYAFLMVFQPISMASFFLNAKEVKVPSNYLEKRLLNVVDEIKIAANYPRKPRVYVIPDPYPNAFAISLFEKEAIGVTAGLLKIASRDELAAVIAHEFSHIINRDSEVKLLAFLGVTVISLAAKMFLQNLPYAKSKQKRSGCIVLILGILFAVIAMFLSPLMFFAISRRREALADVEAVRLTRNKRAMISILRKLASFGSSRVLTTKLPPDASYLFFVPIKVNALFSTHPPIEERIRLLEQL